MRRLSAPPRDLPVGKRSAFSVEVGCHVARLDMVPHAISSLAVLVRRDAPARFELYRGPHLQGSVEEDANTVDAVLDGALTWLCDGTIWCARCGGQVVASAHHRMTFEHMHWVCFHYESEHGDTDVDVAYEGPSCPSARQ